MSTGRSSLAALRGRWAHEDIVSAAQWGQRWVHPDGWAVREVTMAQTPTPSRPGDPPRIGDKPRQLLQVSRLGTRYGYAPSLAELQDMAEAEAWDTAELRQVPTHVVMDALGAVYSHGEDGEPFGRDQAEEFAAKRNAGMAEGKQHWHRVHSLAELN